MISVMVAVLYRYYVLNVYLKTECLSTLQYISYKVTTEELSLKANYFWGGILQQF